MFKYNYKIDVVLLNEVLSFGTRLAKTSKKLDMKALIKIGFVMALCVSAGSVYGQEPLKTGKVKRLNSEPKEMTTRSTSTPKVTPAPTRKGRAVVKAMPAKQAARKPEKVQ